MGNYTLTALGDRLFGAHQAQILILRDGIDSAAHLPGGTILIGSDMLNDEGGPEVLAGLSLMERLRAELNDPILPVLEHAGLTATFRLLTSGLLPDSALAGYGEVFLQRQPDPVPDDLALARFRSAGLASTPYAYAVDPSGETTLGLIEADPLNGLIPEPLMTDGDWVSLQDICSDN